MAVEHQRTLTVEEYFQFEEHDPDTRYEYIEGHDLSGLVRNWAALPAAERARGAVVVVRRIARALGGSVTVESATGGGSAFTIELPLAGPTSRSIRVVI